MKEKNFVALMGWFVVVWPVTATEDRKRRWDYSEPLDVDI